jgi:hypothetical protein
MSAQVKVNGRVIILRYAEVLALREQNVEHSIMCWFSSETK